MLDTILFPLEWFVAVVMVGFHSAFSAIGMPEKSGWTWALSIVGLVIVLRILLIPLFVKQIKSSRRMQLIQPELQKIQAKYKGKKDPESRQKMTEETMELYKRTGTNPFSSCLPMLLQAPFFFALFRVLSRLPEIGSGQKSPIGPLSAQLADQAEKSTLFGSPLSATFMNSSGMSTKIVTLVLIVLMSVSTFTTQHQLMTKNMPAAALDNPMAKQQKILMYILPLVFFFTGPNFPIGVLIYWLVTNIWTMCQQFYVIRHMPAPGSEAEKALEARRAAKGKPSAKLSIPGLTKPEAEAADGADSAVVATQGTPGRSTAGGSLAGKGSGQRVQPTSNKRKKNRKR
ncbi:membrane protein insertase YidC [Calidifontibacter sp. DB0510]|uniref:Membrane protein insertase YidC n=1 Tax=Metallococcus carri TaxID=1656884 RepID=A0A967B296_9MICO|nr:membrane protein insertase YidC [Metallococcus carri]NHN56203.1 membrane protein insertase YidC [Metallococcus carri]NOP38746.1 membrane protein insertase YidC [Calidifontibacter sp. DB2511S]